MGKLRVLGAVLAMMFVIASMAAADYYVDAEEGSNLNSGLSPDDSWGTITYALSAVFCSVEEPAAIHIASGTYSASTNGEVFPLQMRSFISLEGEDAETTILDAENEAAPVLMCDSVEKLTISGLTVTGGNWDRTGWGESYAFYASGVLCVLSSPDIIDCRVSGNMGYSLGGAVYCYGSSPFIMDCEISDNYDTGVKCVECQSQRPFIMRCDISRNGGGGIECMDASPSVKNCTITDNVNDSHGGGVYADSESSPLFEDCVISGNHGDHGGGVSCGGELASPVFVRCEITGNSSRFGGGGICRSPTMQECIIAENTVSGESFSRGGGVYCYGPGLGLSDCHVYGNSARNGGGIYFQYSVYPSSRIENCTISGNEAHSGGGICCFYHSCPEILNCSISENSASSLGGGMYCLQDSTPLLFNCSFEGNSASYGAGLCCEDSAPSIKSCEFKSNRADNDGGAMHFMDESHATVEDCQILDNSSEWSDGGGIYIHGSAPSIKGCLFEGNSADRGGALMCVWAWPTVENSTFSENTSRSHGGAIACASSFSPIFENCDILDNEAAGDGGGVWLGSASCILRGCRLSGNVSPREGGAVYCDTFPVVLENCLIDHNSADAGPAIFYFYSRGPSAILNCTIADNQGGPSIGLNESHVEIENSIIWGNHGGSFGVTMHSTMAARYSCIGGGTRGYGGSEEMCIHSHPLFVEGDSGEYYLSSRLAGQAESSPCIGTGFGPPSDCDLAQTTTRTDGVCDFGIVDMGYHYPGEYPAPKVECYLSRDTLKPGGSMRGYIEVHNEGLDMYADVYVVLVLPGGSTESLTPAGFESGLLPWLSSQYLWSGFAFGPETAFDLEVHSGFESGDWLLAAALTEAGGLGFAGEASVFPFTIEAE